VVFSLDIQLRFSYIRLILKQVLIIYHIIAVQINRERLKARLISLDFWNNLRPSQSQVHHRDTEGTEKDLFVWR